MKIALVHDYIKEYGGAERVLEAMHEIWPDAPVYTTVYLPKFLGPHRERFKDWRIVTSGLQRIPFVQKCISPIRMVAPWVFEQFDFRGYDVVLVSATGAYTPNLLVLPQSCTHICYCHTPPRYLYGYPTARDWKKYWVGRMIGETANHILRQSDMLSYQRPDAIIANSYEVQARIKKFYRRDADVIYPPVEIPSSLSSISKRQEYFLAGGRLARAKHIDIIIHACNQLKLPLKIFGRGFVDYDRELRRIAGKTISFVGEVSDEELSHLYRGAKALLFASELEDFGIMPVEAQGHGTPVIAYASGGVKETVIDGRTGVLYPDLTVEALVSSIQRFLTLRISEKICHDHAYTFRKERFQSELRAYVSKAVKR